MRQEQRELLDRILASGHFSQTITLGRILRYVCEQTANTVNTLKEHEIATEVLRRSQHFDSKFDPVVRVSMKGVRKRLHDYFNGEGKKEPLTLSIPLGQYRAVFADALPELIDTAPSLDALQRFWSPYLATGCRNLILYTEPLFYRDGWDTYVRNLYINDAESGESQFRTRIPELNGRDFRPSFHYLDAGEVHSTFILTKFFQELHAPVNLGNSRLSSWSEIRHSNLILLGCTRTNRFMHMLQEESNFVIGEDSICNLAARDGEQSCYRGSRYSDSRLPRYREYVLVTRRPGASQSSTVTMIAANHGRAIEGCANALTSLNDVEKLTARMGLAQTSFPNRFQLLLCVEMIDLDDEVVDIDYVSHRIPGQ